MDEIKNGFIRTKNGDWLNAKYIIKFTLSSLKDDSGFVILAKYYDGDFASREAIGDSFTHKLRAEVFLENLITHLKD